VTVHRGVTYGRPIVFGQRNDERVPLYRRARRKGRHISENAARTCTLLTAYLSERCPAIRTAKNLTAALDEHGR